MLETLDYTIHTPTFLYFDVTLYIIRNSLCGAETALQTMPARENNGGQFSCVHTKPLKFVDRLARVPLNLKRFK